MFNKKLIVLDLECTGSDWRYYDIIQMGAVKVDESLNTLSTFCEMVSPMGDIYQEAAQKVHKIDFNYAKENGLSLEDCISKFEAWCGDPHVYYLCSWGVMFDISYLQEAYRKVNRKYPFSYRTYDAASVVRFFVASMGLLHKRCGEGACAKVLGISTEHEKKHNALYDSELTVRLLQEVERRIHGK